MAKQRKRDIESNKEIFNVLKKRFIKKNKDIKKIGYALTIKRLTAKILWFSIIFLFINILMPNLTTLFSLAFTLGFNLLSNFISTYFDEKITYIITGKFFDRYSNHLLNQWIFFLLTVFLLKFFLYPKMVELKWLKKNEK